MSIVDVVVSISGADGFDENAGDFDILREALEATSLVAALDDDNASFSVFAPTDAAFIQTARDLGADVADGDEEGAFTAVVGAATALAGGEAAAGLDFVADILLYHVSPGAQTLAELDAAGPIESLLTGATVEVDGMTVLDAEPDIDDPMVVLQDIDAGNGTIQAIDRVLLPLDIEGNSSIVGVAASNPAFSILVDAVVAAGLVETLEEASDTTVFAPTNGAFAALAADLGFEGDASDPDAVFGFIVGALTELGGGDPIPLLTDILLYHVSPGAKTAAEVDALESVPNALGAELGSEGTTLIDLAPEITDPNIVIADVAARDNFVQAIDRVLIPLDLPGPPVVVGSAAADSFTGGAANNQVFGRAGADEINGGAGEDILLGNRGADIIDGGADNDIVGGGLGRDTVSGGDGDDIVRGGRLSDELSGGTGNDFLFGGNGRDTLEGGAGDDVLIGGRGADSFDFTALSGDDIVVDLRPNDVAIFDSGDLADFAALQDAATDGGRGVTVAIGGDSVVFVGQTVESLDPGNFLFT